jgi:dTDP-glucose pyrophosphorylase
MNGWRKMLVKPETPLVEAIKIIDSGGGQIAIVTDADQRLLGVVTDADVRKVIIRGLAFDIPCEAVMTTTPISLRAASSRAERLAMMRHRHIRQLPLIDEAHRVVDVALLADLVASNGLPNAVVIMAGGLGTRLGEMTRNRPKPLLSVGGRPLLETILLRLIDQGFDKFYFAVNFRANMIVEHFGDGSQWGVTIEYLREQTRLGTAGALHLLPPDINHDLIVMNGDILTKVDARHMLSLHRSTGASATLAVKDYVTTIPYGVVEIDDQSGVVGFREKPSHRCFVNAGIYVLSPDILGLIPSGEYFDMPSLFEAVRGRGRRLSAFPIHEYWMDIGQPDDFEQANAEYGDHFDLIDPDESNAGKK